MAKKKNADVSVDEDLELAEWLNAHNALELNLGEGDVLDHWGRKVGEYKIGYLYRLQCTVCGDPKCSKVTRKYDEGDEVKTLVTRDCKKIHCRQITNVAMLNKLLEVE